MNKKYTFGLIGSLLFITLFSSIQPIQGMSHTNDGADPYRLLDTDLEYAIPNGSYFMWNNSQLIIGSAIINNGTGTEIHDHETIDSYWDYRADRFTSHKVDNNNTEIVIKKYSNTTDTPVCPPDIGEWSYNQNQTVLVNKTLVSVINGQNYYPDDVFMDDIFIDNSSFYEALLIDLQLAPLLGFIWEAVDNLTASGNITMYDTKNSSKATITNRYEGRYLYNFSTDIMVNDLEGLSNFGINLTILFDVNAKMNCYHVVETNVLNFTLQAFIINTTNPIENITLELSMIMGNELICSTLVPCAWGYQFFGGDETSEFFAMNWWWILIAVAITIGFAIIVTMLLQRKQCDETVRMIRKGEDRPLTESEFDKLPNACKSNKYRPKL